MPVSKTVTFSTSNPESMPKWVSNYLSKQDRWIRENYTITDPFYVTPDGAIEKFAELSGVKVETETIYSKQSSKLKLRFTWETAADKTMFLIRFS